MTDEILDRLWAGMRDRTKLLILENEYFAVIVDKEDRVYWETSDAYDTRGGHTDIPAWNDFLNKSAYIEITPCSHLDESTRLDFKRLIAEATARALDNDFSNAEKMLIEADKFVSMRNQETSRFWYLSASGVVVVVMLIVGTIFWLCRLNIIPTTGFIAFFAFISAGTIGDRPRIVLPNDKNKMTTTETTTRHSKLTLVITHAADSFSALSITNWQY